MSASATRGGHNNNNHHHHHNKSICIVMWDLKLHMCCVMCVQIVDNMTSLRARGVARNSFWVGINFLLHSTTVLYTNSLTSSAEISAQNNFQ